MVSPGITVRLLPCDLKVMGSSLENRFSTCEGKIMYIYEAWTHQVDDVSSCSTQVGH